MITADLPYAVIHSVQVHDIEGRKGNCMLELCWEQLHPCVITKEGLQACIQ